VVENLAFQVVSAAQVTGGCILEADWPRIVTPAGQACEMQAESIGFLRVPPGCAAFRGKKPLYSADLWLVRATRGEAAGEPLAFRPMRDMVRAIQGSLCPRSQSG
jgi:hypothetical protein